VRTRVDAELAANGLTTPQLMVLAAVDRKMDLSASDLAREFGMTAQTVNVLVKSLESSGMLRRSPHPTHGRILLASLTAEGRRALKRGLELAVKTQDRLLSCLSASERKVLIRHLKTIEEASAGSA
jgi:DNA-binding MarR family transcriptional regulator